MYNNEQDFKEFGGSFEGRFDDRPFEGRFEFNRRGENSCSRRCNCCCCCCRSRCCCRRRCCWRNRCCGWGGFWWGW